MGRPPARFAGVRGSSPRGRGRAAEYVVSKVVLEVIPPFTLLAIRLILGALALGIVIVLRGKTNFTRKQFRDSFLVGVVGHGISLGIQFMGTKLSNASAGSLVTSATPAFVLLFAPFLLRERTTLRGVIALVISSLGVIAYTIWILNDPFNLRTFHPVTSLAIILVDVMVCAYGVNIFLRKGFGRTLRWAWLMLTLGALSFAIAESLWLYYETILEIDPYSGPWKIDG